jgi:hypothetical protein
MSSISAISGMSSYYTNLVPAAQAAQTGSAKEEFMAIFYKELLKQTFKAPDLTFKSEEESDQNFNIGSAFGSEALIEQLADQMAKRMAIQMGWNRTAGEAGK